MTTALLVMASGCEGDVPDVEVRGATDALSFDDWRWASDRKRQLVADMTYHGGEVHDVIVVFYRAQERIGVDGIPGNTFDEPGKSYERRFPIAPGAATPGDGGPAIADTTRLVIHVNRTESDAHDAVEAHGLVPEGTPRPGD